MNAAVAVALRARIYYDHATRELVLTDPETKAEIRRQSIEKPFEMTDVQVRIEPGTRFGCAATGFLGYVEGDVSEQAGPAGTHRLYWCGDHFEARKDDTWLEVTSLARVVVSNGVMSADLV